MDLMLLHGAKPFWPHPSLSELILTGFLSRTPFPYPIKNKGNIAERTQLTGIGDLPVHQILISTPHCECGIFYTVKVEFCF